MKQTLFAATFLAIVLAQPVLAATASNQSITVGESTVNNFATLNGDFSGNFTLVTPPAHGTLLIYSLATGPVTWTGTVNGYYYVYYTPTPLYSGNDSFVWNVANSTGTSSNATFSIWVPANTPPTASNDVTMGISANTARSFTAAFTDPDLGQTWTLHVISPASHGTVTMSGAQFTYTPATGYLGADSFTWKVDDGIATSNVATCSLVVRNDSLQYLANPDPGGGFGVKLLLTDGSVLSFNAFDTPVYRLTPDSSGSYVNGTWSQIASMNYTHGAGASAVLPDGRVLIAAGEWGQSTSKDGTNAVEIYDPVTNVWSAKSGTGNGMKDSAAIVLPNGKVFFGGYIGGIYDPANYIWTSNSVSQGNFDEANYCLLPDGSLLNPSNGYFGQALRYLPQSDQWVNAGITPLLAGDNPANLLYDGRAFCRGNNSLTAFYTPPAVLTDAGSWVAGPNIPRGLEENEQSATVMPNGHLLLEATNGGSQVGGIARFDFDPVTSSFIDIPADSPGLMLPTGQILTRGGIIYTPTGSPNSGGIL